MEEKTEFVFNFGSISYRATEVPLTSGGDLETLWKVVPIVQSAELENNCENKNEKFVWKEAPTKLLILLYEENIKKVGRCSKFESKKKLWEFIAKSLKEKGFMCNASHVENKWRSLKRQYKKNIGNNKIGAQRNLCAYQKELDNIFSGNDAINSTFLLDNVSNAIPKPMVPLVKSETNPSCSTPFSPDSIAEGTENQFSLGLQPTATLSLEEQIKLVLYQKRTEALEQRNELVKQFINVLKN